MDWLERLCAKIPDFPGYQDEAARLRSDELVRAYLGEALAALAERLAPLAPGTQEPLADLLLRTEFANQKIFGGSDHGEITAEAAEAIGASALALLAAADQAPEVSEAAVAAYLATTEQLFDARDAAMLAAAAGRGSRSAAPAAAATGSAPSE